MLRVLTLSTLFPDATRPNFGVFVERQTLELAAHPDVSLRVVAPVGLPPWPATHGARYRGLSALPSVETWKGLAVHRPRFTAMPLTRGRRFVPALTRALIPLLDRLRDEVPFDVIDASFFFPDGPAAVAMGRRYGVPVSIKARGADIHHWGHARATARQVREAGLGADGLLAVSESMRADMAAIGIPESRVRVHRTGVDLDRFAPRDRRAAKAELGVDGPLVVSVGALIPRKGHDIVVRAVASLLGVSLMIVGEGPERGRLASLIATLGVGDRVRLLGSVAHDVLPPLLAAADVMALASASEGLANAWVEAIASGTPVVIADAGGARELVAGEAAGRIVDRTPDAFAAGIAAVLAEASVADAVRVFVKGYTWEANTEALFAHLSSLVSARSIHAVIPAKAGIHVSG